MNATEIKRVAKQYMLERYDIKKSELTAEFLNEVVKGVRRRYFRATESDIRSHIAVVMLWEWKVGRKCFDDDKCNLIDVTIN